LAAGAGALGAPLPDADGAAGGAGGGVGAGCDGAGAGAAGFTVAAASDRRLGVVVDQELMPACIDRGGVFAELAVHLLDEPFVLSEW